MKFVLVTPSDLPKVVECDGKLASIQALLGGGYIECVQFLNGASAYVDEDGIGKGLPANALATQLMQKLGPGLLPGDYIKGNFLVVGWPDDEGREQSVPPDVVNLIMNYRMTL
jgi:hypothetical protein